MSRHNRWIITILLILAGLLLPNPKVAASCGDGICQSNESVNSCQMDCGQRQAVHLVLADWASNVVRYGDLDNDGDNDIITIQSKPVPQSHSCGNNMCETGEDALSCSDCQIGICGNNSCESGESQSCSSDCGPKVYDYNVITAMAAFDLDRCGNLMNCTGQEAMLWSMGTPNDMNRGLPNADIPVQIGDVDGDGWNEVVYVKDWRMVVANGQTLEEKQSISVPKDPATPNPSEAHQAAAGYGRLVAEQLMILPGPGLPRFLIKNRYYNVWAYDQQLQEMWRYDNCGKRNDLNSTVKPCASVETTNTGHMPYPIKDFDNDLNYEVLIGHSLIDDTGEKLWRIQPNPGSSWFHTGHFDGGVIKKLSAAATTSLEVAIASSDLGVYFLDGLSGKVSKHYPYETVKHAQSMSVADFRPDVPGTEVLVANKHHGQLFMFSAQGTMIDSLSFNDTAHHRPLPLYWGDTQRGIYFVDQESQAIYDGRLHKIMHLSNYYPSNPAALKSDVKLYIGNFTGDARDELLFAGRWRIEIYDNPKQVSAVLDSPRRLTNQSNYSPEIMEYSRAPSSDVDNDGSVTIKDYQQVVAQYLYYGLQTLNGVIASLL